MRYDGNDSIEITIYLVGSDEEEARGNLPFDSYESAESYSYDNPGTFIYSVTATIHFETMEKI